MKISLERLARTRLRIPCIGGAFLFKPVAVVPAGSMFRPRPQTHPAKFMLALPTGHVVAASVLFDSRMTFRAFFGIG